MEWTVFKIIFLRIGPKNRALALDLMGKRVFYITRVNGLNQEFYCAHPLTKVEFNNIFNTHLYGSQLWDLFSAEANRLKKTQNISQRIMLGIPQNTHRFFVKALTETQHIKFSLLGWFVNFVYSIKSSTIHVLRNMLENVKHNCHSTTDSNLRKWMQGVSCKGNNTNKKQWSGNQVPYAAELDEILHHILT